MRYRSVFLVLVVVSIFLFCTSVTCLGEAKKQASAAGKTPLNPDLPTVAIIATGGTIAERYDPKTGGADLKKAGALLGGNLTPPYARLLLMLALPVVKQDHQKLADYFWLKGLPG
jgi:L-asparaginase/Glu-tRNA(Gln) amidotransferase subunit D